MECNFVMPVEMPKVLNEFMLSCFMLAIVLDSITGLRFSGVFNSKLSQGGSYAEFNGWPMAKNSKLQFYFKTTASTKTAFLLYQDAKGQKTHDGNTVDDFIEVSLLSNGYVLMHVLANKCSSEQVTVKSNFTDGLWHKLVISRQLSELVLSVDNASASIISCRELPRLAGPRGKATRPLYIGGIPFLNSDKELTYRKWSQIGLLQKIVEENR